jgi:hypothetical protein
MADQLLLLAFWNQKTELKKLDRLYLNGVILDVLSRYSNTIKAKEEIQIQMTSQIFYLKPIIIYIRYNN